MTSKPPIRTMMIITGHNQIFFFTTKNLKSSLRKAIETPRKKNDLS